MQIGESTEMATLDDNVNAIVGFLSKSTPVVRNGANLVLRDSASNYFRSRLCGSSGSVEHEAVSMSAVRVLDWLDALEAVLRNNPLQPTAAKAGQVEAVGLAGPSAA